MVAACHAAFHPDLDQTGDQLKKKFIKLMRTMVSMGNPNIPPVICAAKEIRDLIIERYDATAESLNDHNVDAYAW
jgi:hypothetical protein